MEKKLCLILDMAVSQMLCGRSVASCHSLSYGIVEFKS